MASIKTQFPLANLRPPAGSAGGLLRRVDEEDLWDAWAFAAADAAIALTIWKTAERADQGDAYAAYRAALDREEEAATVLSAQIAMRRVRPVAS
jgi:hypothetical protein